MSVSVESASRAIAAAVRKAGELGVPVNVAVLDDGGHLKTFLRMDGAVLGSIDVALGKAKAAILFGMNSEELFEYCKPGGPAFGLERTNGGLVVFGGGIPLRDADGRVVAAVGVSGGAVHQDMTIAKAAAAAFQNEPKEPT